MKYLLHITPC